MYYPFRIKKRNCRLTVTYKLSQNWILSGENISYPGQSINTKFSKMKKLRQMGWKDVRIAIFSDECSQRCERKEFVAKNRKSFSFPHHNWHNTFTAKVLQSWCAKNVNALRAVKKIPANNHKQYNVSPFISPLSFQLIHRTQFLDLFRLCLPPA